MANSPQARKRARQAETRRQHNASLRSIMRTHIKKVYRAIEAGDKDLARDTYAKAIPVIDKTANKGLIHANKAARHKSRLNRQIVAM